MFYAQLRNELWKLFGKKRTYIGFGAFLVAQNAMLLAFRFTRWQSDMERMLSGNGYFAEEYVSGSADLGIRGTMRDGTSIALREVLVHMIEEYARHCGHADLLRERIDGRIGQ